MISETDLPNKEGLLERKALLLQQAKQLEEQAKAMREQEGQIQSLTRELIHAGIQHQTDVGSRQIHKEVTETVGQQKLLRGQEKLRQKDLDKKES